MYIIICKKLIYKSTSIIILTGLQRKRKENVLADYCWTDRGEGGSKRTYTSQNLQNVNRLLLICYLTREAIGHVNENRHEAFRGEHKSK